VDYRRRTLTSAVGAIRFERAYYHCRHCGRGTFPAEEALRLGEQDLTPGATELVSLAGGLASFPEASQKILPRLAGVRVSESTVERTTETAGRQIGERLARGETFGPAQAWNWHTDAQGRRCAYLSVDATGVPQQGPGGTHRDGRMPWVAQVYNPVPAHWSGKRPPWQSRYLSGLMSLDELGPQLAQQARQVGVARAERWIALSDGGNGLDRFFETYFPQAEMILDFYHVAGHLAEFARALVPENEQRQQILTQQWCHTLKHRGGKVLLEELQNLPLPAGREPARETHRTLLGYFRKNLFRMDYPRYLAHGWQIGSGPIEAACKHVVGQRLKGPGMRWGEDGTDALCHLRALFKSESSQWDSFWNPN
jgi:hypothetical protein